MIEHLATLENMSQHIDTMIPMQVLMEIDNSRNPMLLTKERLERAATENQFMNGKIDAVEVRPSGLDLAMMCSREACFDLQGYRAELVAALREHFPDSVLE